MIDERQVAVTLIGLGRRLREAMRRIESLSSPSVVPHVASALAALLPNPSGPGAVVVSLAPVLTLTRLSELLDGFTRLARVLPNAPSIVRAGFNVRTLFDTGLTPEQVLDLVPVKPSRRPSRRSLQAYRDVLPRLHAKLRSPGRASQGL